MDALLQLDAKLKTYDSTYMYSDDATVYRRGEQQSREIQALIAEARLDGKDEEVDALLKKHEVMH